MQASYNAAATDAGPPIFYVSTTTVPLALAEAVAKVLRKQDVLVLQAIGAGAVYRATQALTIARVLLAQDQIGLGFVPYFGETTLGDQTLVGLMFEVEYRPCPEPLPIRIEPS